MASSNIWYIYILRCCDGSLYTGISLDVFKRLEEHNFSKKAAKYTMARRPVELVFYFEVPNRSSALKIEYKIKKLSKNNKEKIILNPELLESLIHD